MTLLYLFVEFFSDTMSPLNVDVMNFTGAVDVGQFNAHLHGEEAIGFVGPVDTGRVGVIDFGVEFGQNFKMAFQIGG